MSSPAITIYHFTFPFIYLCIYPLPSRLSYLIPLEFSTPFIICISNSYICDRTSDLYSQSQSQSQSLIFNLCAIISQDLLQFSFRNVTFHSTPILLSFYSHSPFFLLPFSFLSTSHPIQYIYLYPFAYLNIIYSYCSLSSSTLVNTKDVNIIKIPT